MIVIFAREMYEKIVEWDIDEKRVDVQEQREIVKFLGIYLSFSFFICLFLYYIFHRHFFLYYFHLCLWPNQSCVSSRSGKEWKKEKWSEFRAEHAICAWLCQNRLFVLQLFFFLSFLSQFFCGNQKWWRISTTVSIIWFCYIKVCSTSIIWIYFENL